jgi:hypothetical protein
MLSCDKVTRLYSSEALRTTPLGRRLAVRFHLLMCRHCRRYVRELAAIGRAARQALRVPEGTDVARLEQRLVAEVHRPEKGGKR